MRVLALAVSLSLAVPAAGQLSPLVAHWPLDASTGTVVADVGPYTSDGTLVNAGPAPWVAGTFGNALQLDGTDDHVSIAANPDLPVYRRRVAPFSIAFWVNAPAQSDRRVYSEQAATPTGLGPLFTLGSGSTAAGATGRLRAFLRTDAAVVAADLLSTAVAFDGSWHHVVYVDTLGVVRIWIDGALDTTFDYSQWAYGPASTLPGSYQALDSVTLGAVVRNGVVSAPLAGALDDVRVYRAALDAADVALIRAGSPPALVAASAGVYGQGCGAGPLRMLVSGQPSYGGTVWLQAAHGTPNGILLLGLGAGLVAPLDLAPFGYAGCTLWLQSPDFVPTGVVGPSGSDVPLPLAVPNQPALNGQLFALQWVNVLPATLEWSPAAVLQVGR